MSLFLLILFFSLTLICVPLPNNKRQLHGGIEKAADLLRHSINESADPCEDFYEFTCGNWAVNNPIPPNRKSFEHFDILRIKVMNRMKDLLEESVISPSSAINMVKSMYKSCMNIEELSRQRTSILVSQLEKFGYWPILHDEQWDVNTFDLTKILKDMAYSRGILDVFISSFVHVDQRNASRHIIILNYGMPFMNVSQNDAELQQYAENIAKMVENIAADAGINISHERIIEEAQQILKFERDYVKIKTPPVEITTPPLPEGYPNKMISLIAEYKHYYRLSHIIKLLPELDLWEFFALLLHVPDNANLSSYFASDPDMVFLFDPNFLSRLSKLLKNTDKRTIANYVLLRYVADWQEIGEKFKLLNTQQERWVQCLSDICPGVFGLSTGPFIYACDAIYATKFFNKESNDAVNEMVKDLRHVFAQMIENSEWLDPQTKNEALDKLKQMKLLAGYPAMLLGVKPLEALDEYYSKLNLYENYTYATMKEKLSQWFIHNHFRKLVQPVNRNEFDISNCDANAAYVAAKNSIQIPSVLYEAPFFDKNFPFAMNYGAIGSILGHEITHGFDDEGSKYGKIGTLDDWWQPETRKCFNKRKQCFIDQYSLMQIPETNKKLNGTISQGENIADNGGLKEAFKAYKFFLKETGHIEKQVPGFERFTSDQLFFMSFGLQWCEHTTKESLEGQHNLKHPPGRYRVNGVVQNFPDFAKAFNCEIGSVMNPVHKCALW